MKQNYKFDLECKYSFFCIKYMLLSKNSHMCYGNDWGFKYSDKYFSKKRTDAFRNFNKNKKNIKQNNIHCGAVILNSDCTKILLIKNKYLSNKFNIVKWGPPKGHLEKKDRNYLSCAVRETYEETGIQLKYPMEKPSLIRINLTYYFPLIIDDTYYIKFEPIDKKEIEEVKWISFDDLNNMDYNDMNRDLKVILERFKSRIIHMCKSQNK